MDDVLEKQEVAVVERPEASSFSASANGTASQAASEAALAPAASPDTSQVESVILPEAALQLSPRPAALEAAAAKAGTDAVAAGFSTSRLIRPCTPSCKEAQTHEQTDADVKAAVDSDASKAAAAGRKSASPVPSLTASLLLDPVVQRAIRTSSERSQTLASTSSSLMLATSAQSLTGARQFPASTIQLPANTSQQALSSKVVSESASKICPVPALKLTPEIDVPAPVSACPGPALALAALLLAATEVVETLPADVVSDIVSAAKATVTAAATATASPVALCNAAESCTQDKPASLHADEQPNPVYQDVASNDRQRTAVDRQESPSDGRRFRISGQTEQPLPSLHAAVARASEPITSTSQIRLDDRQNCLLQPCVQSSTELETASTSAAVPIARPLQDSVGAPAAVPSVKMAEASTTIGDTPMSTLQAVQVSPSVLPASTEAALAAAGAAMLPAVDAIVMPSPADLTESCLATAPELPLHPASAPKTAADESLPVGASADHVASEAVAAAISGKQPKKKKSKYFSQTFDQRKRRNTKIQKAKAESRAARRAGLALPLERHTKSGLVDSSAMFNGAQTRTSASSLLSIDDVTDDWTHLPALCCFCALQSEQEQHCELWSCCLQAFQDCACSCGYH